MLSEWRQVAFVEGFVAILEEVCCRRKGHIGGSKTVTEVCAISIGNVDQSKQNRLCMHLY